jgi:hypothetical protein
MGDRGASASGESDRTLVEIRDICDQIAATQQQIVEKLKILIERKSQR